MIIQEHEYFAREIVALARKRGMDSIDMTFNLSHGFEHRKENENRHRDCFERIRMHWCEGRHGVRSDIRLETNANKQIRETEEIEIMPGR